MLGWNDELALGELTFDLYDGRELTCIQSLDRTTGVANALFVQVLPSPDWVTKELWTNLETQVQEYIMQGMGGVEAVPMQPPIPAAVEVKPAFRVLDRPLDVVE